MMDAPTYKVERVVNFEDYTLTIPREMRCSLERVYLEFLLEPRSTAEIREYLVQAGVVTAKQSMGLHLTLWSSLFLRGRLVDSSFGHPPYRSWTTPSGARHLEELKKGSA